MMKHLRQTRSLGIGVQLTLWYTGIFALLILLFSLIFYITMQAFLASGVDSALQLRAQQIAGGVSSENNKIVIQDVTGELPGLDTATPLEHGATAKQTGGSNGTIQQDVNIGILVRMLDVKGQTIYVSPAFHALSLPPISFTDPLHGSPWQGTVAAHDGQQVRIYSVVLTDNGTAFGVLQVGETLAQLTTTLQNIVLALLVLVPFVLLLGAFGSYWLAKRAFRPMLYLTRIAREIKAGDLHRRVPVPLHKDEVYDLALTLNEMIERLDQAFMQQRRFVADASHELRTPVTVIRSITDVALEEPQSLEECVEALRDINAETERQGQLINDLLTLARTDEEQMPLDSELVQLDLLVSDVVVVMEPLAVERGIKLQFQETEAVTILGDTTHLIQMIMGLVDNALTYTNAGGTVTLGVSIHANSARLVVRDTGVGIAEEDVIHIFERFYRADTARSRVANGSGLGLALADWVIRAHGGSIAVESTVGQGSIFTVTLPLMLSTPSCLTP
ncbi:MAG TPA: HAMP domain-containing sensor histidine kinase [Ktedonobacteraceae bacterium]|jgi:signal transduction histidine kinase|nr:HAMP domain-containing sensor histidine kinase [Ktedonobacteraceae bacterium]